MKGLPGLIRLNQWKVDEQRRKVTELEMLAEELAEQIAGLQVQVDREGRNAGDDLGSREAFSRFLQGALSRRKKLEGSITDLADQISAAKDGLADAYRELKSYEIAQANRDRRETQKNALRDRVKMDEIGAALHRRRAG